MNNLFLFTGNHNKALREKLHFWQQEFIKKHTAANLEIFTGIKNEDLASIMTSIESEPFLGTKRMIVIRGLPKSPDETSSLDTSALEEMLGRIPESSLIIFVSPLPDKRTSLYKKLLKKATALSFDIPKGLALRDWIEGELKKAQKRITPSALDRFLFYTSEEGSQLETELEKLSLIKALIIEEKHIEQWVTKTPESHIFSALNLIGTSTTRDVLRAFHELKNRGEEMTLIFFMIVRQCRLLIQIRSLLDQQSDQSTILHRLKISPFQLKALMRQAQRISLQRLQLAYRHLADIDLGVKTGKLPASSGNDALLQLKIDQFLCSMTE